MLFQPLCGIDGGGVSIVHMRTRRWLELEECLLRAVQRSGRCGNVYRHSYVRICLSSFDAEAEPERAGQAQLREVFSLMLADGLQRLSNGSTSNPRWWQCGTLGLVCSEAVPVMFLSRVRQALDRLGLRLQGDYGFQVRHSERRTARAAEPPEGSSPVSRLLWLRHRPRATFALSRPVRLQPHRL